MLVLLTCTLMVVRADHVRRRHHHGAARGRRAVLADRWSASRCSSPRSALIVSRMVPQFRLMQKRIDTRQPGAARADHRHPGRARLRARAGRARAVRRRQRRTLTDTALRVGRLMALMFPTVMLVLNVSSVAVLWFGGHRVADGADADRRADRVPQLPHADPHVDHDGDLHAGHGPARRRVRRAHHRGARHRPVGGRRRRPVDDLAPRAAPSSCAASTFSYPGAERPGAARHVASRAGPGQTTAIIGSTGCRQDHAAVADPAAVRRHRRRVLVDGVDVRDLDPDAAAQRGSGWCRSGRTCSPARSRATCATASPTRPTTSCGRRCEIAQADDFVAALPTGSTRPIAQGGTNFSGGQRQRLAIARAVVREPEIYLFDDSFSALDLATDARLRAALRPVTARRRR